jgi:hypothetical protein
MLIRFLQTVPSPEQPDYPFVTGQIIAVDAPPAWMLALLDGVRAEAIKTQDVERAVVEAPSPVRRRKARA